MRICFLTLGTRGDVQPYLALARELVRRGHSAIISTGESFRQFIEAHGVEYARVELDLMAMLKTPEGSAVFHGGIRHFRRAMKYTKNVFNPAFRKSLDDFWRCAQGADVIVYHPKVTAAVDMAQALDIPAVNMPPVPTAYPVSEFPNPAVAPAGDFGALLNRLSYALTARADIASMREINDFRQKTLGQPGRKAGVYAYKNGDTDIPIVYPVSATLFPDVTSWNGRVFLPGFFYLDEEAWSLPQEAERFLAAGKAPIVVTFGSMPLRKPETFRQKLLGALRQSGDRAVILTGMSGLDFEQSDGVLALESAPHSLLFPRAKGIVHHGGVGTMAEALRSGAPQLIIPFSVDQPFWANRLSNLGYALPPLRENTLTQENLIYAFSRMENPDIIEKVRRIQGTVQMENGVGNAAMYLEGLAR
jgi:sterol 3beta-glucosyltransferase